MKYHKNGRDCIEFIASCFERDASSRPTAKALLNCKWMRRFKTANEPDITTEPKQLYEEKTEVGINLYRFKKASDF